MVRADQEVLANQDDTDGGDIEEEAEWLQNEKRTFNFVQI